MGFDDFGDSLKKIDLGEFNGITRDFDIDIPKQKITEIFRATSINNGEMELEHLEKAVTQLGTEHAKEKLREKSERLKEFNLVAKQLALPREYPNALRTHEYHDKIAAILDSKMEKYSKYVENNLRQANLLSHQIVPLGKLGKRKAADRRVLLGVKAKKAKDEKALADGNEPVDAKDQDKGPEDEAPADADVNADNQEGEDDEKVASPLPKIDPYLVKVDKLDDLEKFLEEPIPFEDAPLDEDKEAEDADAFAAGDPELQKKSPEPTEETDQAAAERAEEQAAEKEARDRENDEDRDEFEKAKETLKCQITLDTTVEDFEENGGKVAFVENLVLYLGIEDTQIRVTGVRQGSVIIDYEIIEDSSTGLSLADI